ncbi:MAG: hypothetical protein HN405_04195 [Planctomycetes bacterium]|nr:hypothetical protein [Planctomycetota bacterium]MBT4029441.1 hypothetical protein [Planctomycetota bacterium]MBT4559984.1 hypothetical protein [Planctomycetota bacterium]MBT5102095.1 hypothetical protein [Planctomycetota bacterium]MBT7013296.1 hypothetical protein [Planctomycetota bacterium]
MFETAQAHLLLVHLPVVGGFFALLTLAVAQWRKDETIWKLGIFFLLLCMLGSVGAYYTGPTAVDALRHAIGSQADAMQDAIELHAVWGRGIFVGFILVCVLGIQTWLQSAQGLNPSVVLKAAVILGLCIALAASGWAAHLGGLIRHAAELG